MYNNDLSNNSLNLFIGSVSNAVASAPSLQTTYTMGNSSAVFMLVGGGGAGGSSGWSDVSGSSVSPGGGGGGSGAFSIGFLPSYMCPKNLAVLVGSGGAGGVASRTASAAGRDGGISIVAAQGMTNNQFVAFGRSVGGTGSTAATTSAAGGAGLAGSTPTNVFAIYNSRAASGLAGDTTTSPGLVTGVLVGGGGGGAGITTTDIAAAGGSITGYGKEPQITGVVGSSTAPITPNKIFNPDWQSSFRGGVGGGSTLNGPGGTGGNGAYCSGGGGGGASHSVSDVGGSGGAGGAGIIMIIEV